MDANGQISTMDQEGSKKRSKSTKYQCPYPDCQRVLCNLTSFNNHRKTHTGEKPYPCELCPKRFNTAGNLRDHTNRHLNNKPFECRYCPSKFYRNKELELHYATCDGQTLAKSSKPRIQTMKKNPK